MCSRKIAYPFLFLCVLIFIMSWKSVPIEIREENRPKELQKEAILEDKPPSATEIVEMQIQEIFQESGLEDMGLAFHVFRLAYIGFVNLQDSKYIPQNAHVLTIADFSLSSKEKRLWIVDLVKKKLLINTWVSHGRGSGGEIATQFSNTMSSHQSSLGFYVTGEVYQGKHGRSLRLDGMDKGFNNRARDRAIVIHGASYVSAQAIRNLNRLGLSHGCPAVPVELSNQVIDLVKEKTVLYVHADVANYHSKFLNEETAGKALMAAYLADNGTEDHQRL